MRKAIGTILIAGTLALGACDSDDDSNDGGNDPDMSGNPPGMPDGTPPISGDVFALAARMDGDDAAPLDRAALQTQLDTLLGDADSDDPLAVEDGDTALTALRRRGDAGG